MSSKNKTIPEGVGADTKKEKARIRAQKYRERNRDLVNKKARERRLEQNVKLTVEALKKRRALSRKSSKKYYSK
ncbi:hypothetical protein VKT23_019965 [Stygiomarasmius scandens]|uniref:BZIP domain-containing protein n=1 Tax=Marasmiellus scandens TaxID=2682957 RepID=A0ABR1IK00_9AGAR